jgi:proline dehydrogenase
VSLTKPKIWQAGMIALARSPRVTSFMQSNAAASALAGRFVVGATAAAACDAARRLEAQGFKSSLYHLGEYVADPAKVSRTIECKLEIARLLGEAGLEVHISLDLTQIGYSIGEAIGSENAQRIGAAIADQPGTARKILMFNMEDAPFVDRTLDLRTQLRARNVPVAQTLQAYLRRTQSDMQMIVAEGAVARLVKGAYVDAGSHAFPTRAEIDRSYLDVAAVMLAPSARERGFFPVFGTHDERMIEPIRALAARNGWQAGQYEFEMLYGVRPELQRRLRESGVQVRLYLPFGEDWFPYAVRRVGESPRNAWLLTRALLSKN